MQIDPLRHRRLAPLLFAGAFCWPAAAEPVRIYVSYGAGGEVRYASQPYDATYRPYGGVEDNAAPRAMPAAAGRGRAAAQARTAPFIDAAARKYRLDPALLSAVISTESAFDAGAVSPRGAVGLMQLMPATAARYGVADARDPGANVDAGARHLSDLLGRFDGNLALALAAYNAGEGAVARHARRIPPYQETMLYVPTVLARYAGYKQAEAVPDGWPQRPAAGNP